MSNLREKDDFHQGQDSTNRILLVDDDLELLDVAGRFLTDMGHEYQSVSSAQKACEILDREDFDIIVSDMVMPEMDGMELLEHVSSTFPHIDVVIITGFSKNYTFNDVINAGAKDFLEKPFSKDAFQATLNHIIRARELQHSLIQEIEVRRRTERKLQNALKKVTEANRIKKEFMARVSHELRTPMNGIIGFTDLLIERGLAPTEHRYLKIIKTSADRLMDNITTILDFSEIEDGTLELKELDFNLEQILANIVEQFRDIATLKSITLSTEIADDIPPKLIGDRSLLVKILNHLLDNAIKFTDHGVVGIIVKLSEQMAGRVMVEFTVWDTGCGVSAAKHQDILAAFSQADGSFTRQHDGLGLGLTIAAQLTTLMGGKMTLSDSRDHNLVTNEDCQTPSGLSIQFVVPLCVDPASKATETDSVKSHPDPPENSARTNTVHILLAEDDVTNGFLLTEFFEINGWKVTLAKNGEEALSAFNNTEFDLAIFDIMMPKMDGFEATSAIRDREQQSQKKNLPIIAFTGLAMPGIHERCTKAGMDDYIAKPICTQKLLELVRKHLPEGS